MSREAPDRPTRSFDVQQVRGQSGTITAVVNALAKAGDRAWREWKHLPKAEGEAALVRLLVCKGCTKESKITSNALASNTLERRGWDSNPRYGYPYNGFRVLRFSCWRVPSHN
jgi:hypothetical protein